MRKICGWMLAAVAAIVPAYAGQAADKNAIGFGLDRLHWNMTPAEARTHYPALSAGSDGSLTNLSTYILGHYRAGPCTFSVTLGFAQDRLAKAVLTTGGDLACRNWAKDELTRQYGQGIPASAPSPYLDHLAWRGPVTGIAFNSGFGMTEISFRSSNGPDEIDFDVVGRAPAEPQSK
jgi:hypothetical protein